MKGILGKFVEKSVNKRNLLGILELAPSPVIQRLPSMGEECTRFSFLMKIKILHDSQNAKVSSISHQIILGFETYIGFVLMDLLYRSSF